MADMEQLAILKEGVNGWNEWREKNLEATIDLIRADLSKANLFGAHLSGASLIRANLSGADLSGANLSGANLSGADLSGAHLIGASLIRAHLIWANLSGADLSGANLSGADLSGAHLIAADLSEADLSEADLSGADLIDCRIYGIVARDVKLEGAIQENLIITELGEPPLVVQRLEEAYDAQAQAELERRLREGEKAEWGKSGQLLTKRAPSYWPRDATEAKAEWLGQERAEKEAREAAASFRRKFEISLAYPKLLSKRFSSVFLVQIFLPEMRSEVSATISQQFPSEQPIEQVQDSQLETGQKVKVKIFCPEIAFSEYVVKKLDKGVNAVRFIAKPDDNCYPGSHQCVLSISDAKSEIEYESMTFTVQVVDFAFDHVSRPLLSRTMSVVLGIGSLTMFVLTLLGQIDTTFGLTSGTVAGAIAGGIYLRFFTLFQQPKAANTP